MTSQITPDSETCERWEKDPKYWKLGFIYYNREDKRIFPPKRCKSMGWTINFANPASIVAFTLIIVGVIMLTNWFPT